MKNISSPMRQQWSSARPKKSQAGKKTIADAIDIKKIASGSRFKKGSFSSPRKAGLKGQLGAMKRAFRHTRTANLSPKNLKDIYALISEEMKKNLPMSKIGITKSQEKKILHKARKKVRSDKTFSEEDFKDLKRIVSTIRQKYREQVLYHTSKSEAKTQMRSPDTSIANKRNNAETNSRKRAHIAGLPVRAKTLPSHGTEPPTKEPPTPSSRAPLSDKTPMRSRAPKNGKLWNPSIGQSSNIEIAADENQVEDMPI